MKKSLWARMEIPLETTKENIWSVLTLPELKKNTCTIVNCIVGGDWAVRPCGQEFKKTALFTPMYAELY